MPKTSANSIQPAPFKRLRDYNYYNQFNYKILFGAFDYMPKSSLTSVQKQNSLLMLISHKLLLKVLYHLICQPFRGFR
ncbi:hypothetical protein ACXO4I_07510, partial [Lactobacillus delbrueckii subsp. bulgaricus]